VADVEPGDLDGVRVIVDSGSGDFSGYARGEVMWLENRGKKERPMAISWDHHTARPSGAIHVPVGRPGRATG
jgi:hypothetical protein